MMLLVDEEGFQFFVPVCHLGAWGEPYKASTELSSDQTNTPPPDENNHKDNYVFGSNKRLEYHFLFLLMLLETLTKLRQACQALLKNITVRLKLQRSGGPPPPTSLHCHSNKQTSDWRMVGLIGWLISIPSYSSKTIFSKIWILAIPLPAITM